MSHASHSSHGSHGSHHNHGNHSNHGNHANYYHHDVNEDHSIPGTPKNLTWSNWDTTIADDDYIHESVPKIEELREKIKYLRDEHGPATWDVNNNEPDNISLDWTGAEPEEFDGSGTDYVEDVNYDTLRDNFNLLKEDMSGTTAELPNTDPGTYIQSEHFAELKAEIDNLAAEDFTSQYSNHENHNDHANHNDHSNHSNHSNHGNHGSYAN
ncbi:MAG: hypothetical protein ACOCP4_02210 [Candidatus Woesearchaeota archaeon]